MPKAVEETSEIICPLIPAPGYFIVEPYEEPSTGGFAVPDSVKEKETQSKGKVLIVSPEPYTSDYGAQVASPDLQKGDIVIHRRWGHEDITWENKKYRAVKHIDFVAQIGNTDN